MNRETPLRQLHERSRAKMDIWFGVTLPSGYGDPASEYRLGRETVALIDTNFQLLAELRGPDRIRFLNAVSSGNILALKPGQHDLGLLLNPQGHILAELRTLALEDRLWVLSHLAVAERTLATLDKFIIMDDVELTDRTGDFGTFALVGPRAPAVVEAVAGIKYSAISENEYVEASTSRIPYESYPSTSLGLPGAEFLVKRQHLPALWEKLVEAVRRQNGGVVGYETANILRLEAGIPWFGVDFDDRFIPHEAGLENSHISYTKGCYTGQEIVERVRSRGHANRRLLPLSFSNPAVPGAGAKLTADGKDAGWVTSAAFSPQAGHPVGLGYLRREFHSAGTHLQWAQGEAEVVSSPFAAANRAKT